MTTLLTAAVLLGATGRTLAQNTPEENNDNLDTPFVRNIRPDRPGQTITAHVLHPGQFQLETGVQRQLPAGGFGSTVEGATLRIGFLSSIELRATQGYRVPGTLQVQPNGDVSTTRRDSAGWAPLLVGAKFMISPNRDTRTQVAILAETTVPGTGTAPLTGWAPSARLLVGQQLGERFGLEGNFGFGQRGTTVADMEKGQYLASVLLNGPLGRHAGFFVEGYGQGRTALTTGTTAGVYWRPAPGFRLDVNAGRVLAGPAAGSSTVGAGLSVRVGK